MPADLDISLGLQQRVREALDVSGKDMRALRIGIGDLARQMGRLLRNMELFCVDLMTELRPEDADGAIADDALWQLVGLLEDTLQAEAEILRALDLKLGDAWRNLFACYDAHQLRQARLLQAHLGSEELLEWLDFPVDDAEPRLATTTECPHCYPADEIENALRFKALVWNMSSGLRSTLAQQEHEGWISFELALLLSETFRRRHAQLEAGVEDELRRAREGDDELEQAMWEDFMAVHQQRFGRWWRLFGPIHSWLCERLELCPSGLDRVFEAVGPELWELPMPELLDQARELLV